MRMIQFRQALLAGLVVLMLALSAILVADQASAWGPPDPGYRQWWTENYGSWYCDHTTNTWSIWRRQNHNWMVWVDGAGEYWVHHVHYGTWYWYDSAVTCR